MGNRQQRRSASAQAMKDPAMAQAIRAATQGIGVGGPSIVPLKDDDEKKSLECLRYQHYLRQISQQDQQRMELHGQVQNGQQALADMVGRISHLVAEARDQATVLVEKFGMDQVQIDRLGPVPSVAGQINIKSVLAQAGPPAPPEPEPEVEVATTDTEEADTDEPEESL